MPGSKLELKSSLQYRPSSFWQTLRSRIGRFRSGPSQICNGLGDRTVLVQSEGVQLEHSSIGAQAQVPSSVPSWLRYVLSSARLFLAN